MQLFLCADGLKRPRPHLSWSQFECFEKSPADYAMRYMYGDNPTTISMTVGKEVHELIQNDKPQDDPTKEIIRICAPRYGLHEHKIEVELNGVPLIGILDGLDLEPTILGETKTGSRAWDQERVDKHRQIDFYLLLLYLKLGIKPEGVTVRLDWFPTEWNGGDPTLTGEMNSFITRRTTLDILKMGKDAVDMWKKIGAFCADEYRANSM